MVKVAKKAKKTSKTSRKDLKQPDQFIEATNKSTEWIVEYKTQLIAIVIGAFVLLGGIYFFQAQQNSQAITATTDLSASLKIFNATISKTKKSTDEKKVFATKKAKYEAAVQSFQAFLKKNKGARANTLAYLYLGHSQYYLGQFQAAQSSYGSFLQKVSKKDPMYFLGVEGLVRVQSALKKPQIGLAKLQTFKESGAEKLRPFALLRLAEYHQQQKNYKRARLYYKQLSKVKDLSPSLKTTAQRRLAVLP